MIRNVILERTSRRSEQIEEQGIIKRKQPVTYVLNKEIRPSSKPIINVTRSKIDAAASKTATIGRPFVIGCISNHGLASD